MNKINSVDKNNILKNSLDIQNNIKLSHKNLKQNNQTNNFIKQSYILKMKNNKNKKEIFENSA